MGSTNPEGRSQDNGTQIDVTMAIVHLESAVVTTNCPTDRFAIGVGWPTTEAISTLCVNEALIVPPIGAKMIGRNCSEPNPDGFELLGTLTPISFCAV